MAKVITGRIRHRWVVNLIKSIRSSRCRGDHKLRVGACKFASSMQDANNTMDAYLIRYIYIHMFMIALQCVIYVLIPNWLTTLYIQRTTTNYVVYANLADARPRERRFEFDATGAAPGPASARRVARARGRVFVVVLDDVPLAGARSDERLVGIALVVVRVIGIDPIVLRVGRAFVALFGSAVGARFATWSPRGRAGSRVCSGFRRRVSTQHFEFGPIVLSCLRRSRRAWSRQKRTLGPSRMTSGRSSRTVTTPICSSRR